MEHVDHVSYTTLVFIEFSIYRKMIRISHHGRDNCILQQSIFQSIHTSYKEAFCTYYMKNAPTDLTTFFSAMILPNWQLQFCSYPMQSFVIPKVHLIHNRWELLTCQSTKKTTFCALISLNNNFRNTNYKTVHSVKSTNNILSDRLVILSKIFIMAIQVYIWINVLRYLYYKSAML